MAPDAPNPAVVVVGASAGGIEALTALARGLPETFPAAVVVVLHLPSSGTSVLPAILDRAGVLPATAATDGAPIEAGHIYGDAVYGGMPRAALERTEVDHVVALRDLPRLLAQLVDGGAADLLMPAPVVPDPIVDISPKHDPATGFICPGCGGALWEADEAGVRRFRCRIGHAFSEDTLVDEQGQMLENALWSALRVLEERADLLGRMATRAEAAGHRRSAASFLAKARDAEHQAEIIRAGVLPVGADVASTGEDVAS